MEWVAGVGSTTAASMVGRPSRVFAKACTDVWKSYSTNAIELSLEHALEF